MAQFVFSVLNFTNDCVIHTGTDIPGGKCYLQTVPNTKGVKAELFECMAVAFTKDGKNAFGITFEGEFIFFRKECLVKGFPV